MKSLGLTATFYFPVNDNDGEDLTPQLKEFQRFLGAQYGGYTYLGLAHGNWFDPSGVEYEDEHHIIEVSHEKLSRGTIEALAAEIRRTAKQISVYLKIDGKAYLV